MTRHRTRTHLQPARGWTNDPIGPVRWGGRYHLFHQANPLGGYWDRPHWGHFVSDDLVTWEELPLALSPTPGGPDADGCFSGCVVIDGARVHAFYTGASGPLGPRQSQVTCVATSDDPELRRWTKQERPVAQPPAGFDLLGFRDPFVWRHGGDWLQLVGSGIVGRGGALFLYRSADLERWDYVGPALIGDTTVTDPLWTGSMWECPALLQLDGVDVLLLSVHDGDTTHYPVLLPGRFDGVGFAPEGAVRMDLGPDFYAPCVLVDGAGRHVCWGWSWEARPDEAQRAAGWAGVLSLPRLLTRRGSGFGVEPLPELTRLRADRRRYTAEPTSDGWRAVGAEGDPIELSARFPPQPGPVGLRVGCSPDTTEHTLIRYERDRGWLSLDRQRASLDPAAAGGTYGGELELSADEPLDLRVFIDGSIIEVFANGRAALTARTYPTRADSTGVEVVGDPAAAPRADLEVWDLAPVLGAG